MIRRIVVGVDGSEGSNRALAWSARLAREVGAEVVAVHAVHVPAYALPYIVAPGLGSAAPDWSAELRRAFEEEWCAPLNGVPHRRQMAEGTAAQVIAGAAEHEDADLVVVGSRGLGGVKELMFGSVSHRLAHLVTRPLVIVPPPRG